MTGQQLEHIIRAAGSITDEKVILVLGSQSILGSSENASEKLLLSCRLAQGWEKRLISIKNENTNGITGLRLGADDMACSKLAAGRAKDLDFVTKMLATGVVKTNGLSRLIPDLPRAEHRVAAQRSLQIVEHRIRFAEIAHSKEPQLPEKNFGREKDRDELSL